MTDSPHGSRKPNPSANLNGDVPTPHGFSHLARRIASWAVNIFATAVLLILGLTFGKQVLEWWRDDSAMVADAGSSFDSGFDGLADPRLPHLLAFGDLPYTFRREVYKGDEDGALARLRASCRDLVTDVDATQPTPVPTSDTLLRQLESYPPVEEGPNWRIVQNRGPVITVVALQMSDDATTDQTDVTGVRVESVLSWGLGFRAMESVEREGEGAREERWTLFTCSGQNQAVDSDLGVPLPLPPGSRRTLAMRVENGGALLAFVGSGTALATKEFFNQSLAQQGWLRSAAWVEINSTWYARFAKQGTGVCDVQVLAQADNKMSGILTTSAPPNSEK